MISEPHLNIPHDQSLARFHRGYYALFALIEDFPEDRREMGGACGLWSPREIVAHLNGWLEEGSRRLIEIQAGDRKNRQYDEESDHAAFNEESVAVRASLTWEQTHTELRERVTAYAEQARVAAENGFSTDARVQEWTYWLWYDCVEHMGHLSRFALD